MSPRFKGKELDAGALLPRWATAERGEPGVREAGRALPALPTVADRDGREREVWVRDDMVKRWEETES